MHLLLGGGEVKESQYQDIRPLVDLTHVPTLNTAHKPTPSPSLLMCLFFLPLPVCLGFPPYFWATGQDKEAPHLNPKHILPNQMALHCTQTVRFARLLGLSGPTCSVCACALAQREL